mgnify:CR=1 FL=1
MNKVILVGRLCKEHFVDTSTKTVILRNTVAINRGKELEADFIPVTAFGKTAEFIEKYFDKGATIVIEGRIDIKSENVGTKRNPEYKTYASVVVEKVKFA